MVGAGGGVQAASQRVFPERVVPVAGHDVSPPLEPFWVLVYVCCNVPLPQVVLLQEPETSLQYPEQFNGGHRYSGGVLVRHASCPVDASHTYVPGIVCPQELAAVEGQGV